MKTALRFSIVALFCLLAAFATASAETLKLLSSYPPQMAFVEGSLKGFYSNLERLSGGTLSTSYSGPDVVPTVEQFQPVQSGVFDLLFTIGPYHMGTTAIGAVVDTIDPDPVKRRQHGIFRFIDEHYNTLGMKVIAIIPVVDLHILTSKPLEGRSPSLSGLKIRTAPTAVPMIKALGGSPVNMGPGEVYTALQKGVIDGTVMLSYGAWNYKWHEVTRYYVKPSFSFLSTFLFMNLDRYRGLSAAERESITEAGRLAELEAAEYFRNQKAAEIAKLEQHGLKVTRMTAEDTAKVDQLINSTVWAFAIKKSGKAAEELRSLALKAGMTK